MARKPFVVLDAEILSSSVWSEAPHVRLVWITLLILCDTDGYVGASVPGIARAAGVPLEEARDAMERLQAPDPYSRTKASDGRRVEVAERGFRVLNFLEHLDRLSAERTKARERVRRHRERLKKRNSNVTGADGNVTVCSGSSDQGPGTSEQTEGRKDGPSPLPADIQGERLLHESRIGKERRFYGLIQRLSALQPEKDPPDIAREVTSYQSKDGKQVKGVVRPEGMSDERLDRSLEDAEWWLEELTKPKEVPRGA